MPRPAHAAALLHVEVNELAGAAALGAQDPLLPMTLDVEVLEPISRS